MTTLSIIKADTGGFVGRSAVHPVLLASARDALYSAVGDGLLPDGRTAACGDDLSLRAAQEHGPDYTRIHEHAHPSRFDDPPRVVALGFEIRDGELAGPRDIFVDPAFDRARAQANEAMDYLRRHGPFEPHRLPLEDLEYTTMRVLGERMAPRWRPMAPDPVTTPG
ncbi:fructose 1,6-bisphosphatase [Prauserella flavalba]|uniref:Fructose-1,6-bisphosphate aldolase/phosphatase n=1 Tax=Prauserella flavalba TaxID=1477506 RepID=A0A318M1W3_9PSEU|nr:fructose 1,6-bisphosphatase [Prauserella flavalba]PXY36525.1 hypothetical protein BA062_14155 [Prauserella flavalba]